MNAAHELLVALSQLGATVELTKGRLTLRARNTPIPGALVSRLPAAKADLIATLARPGHQKGGCLREAADHHPTHSTSWHQRSDLMR